MKDRNCFCFGKSTSPRELILIYKNEIIISLAPPPSFEWHYVIEVNRILGQSHVDCAKVSPLHAKWGHAKGDSTKSDRWEA